MEIESFIATIVAAVLTSGAVSVYLAKHFEKKEQDITEKDSVGA